MKTILKTELAQLGAFTTELPSILQRVVNVNTFNIPYKMKALIAMSELMAFASQFKRNIQLPDDTIVPINSIAFCIAPSGANKDSSLRTTRRIFVKAYELITDQRVQIATQKAIAAAQEAGESSATDYEIYKAYYTEPVAVFLKDVTPQGLVQYMNDIAQESLGAGLMVNSEIADEFNSNPHFSEIIKVLSEAYDLGILEASYTKGKEYRNNGVSGVPFSALFIGSYYMLMYDNQLKSKFIASFMSKLSRRCSFVYVPDAIEDIQYSSGTELIKAEKAIREQSKLAAEMLVPEMLSIATANIKKTNTNITLTDEADTIALLLKRYDTEVATSKCLIESADSLYTKNRYWRAVKLAGALALLDTSDVITSRHMVDAINITELFSQDMALFEHDLNKAPHERFSDYIRTQVQLDGKASVSIHELKKNNFISSVSRHKLQELVSLCAGYDPTGIYSITNEASSIQYEPIVKTDVIGISFKPIDCTSLNAAVAAADPDAIRNAKHAISVTTAYGFEIADTTFPDLSNLLSGDFAYSPFKFANGVRSKENILGGAKWLVLDIDSSPISASEAHFMLSDINHHIALSTDPTNEFKFRVLIELDSYVELTPVAWKHFYLTIAKDLALNVDPLPQSQIFFSYAGRPVLSNTDASPLEVRTYVMHARELEATKPTIERLSTAQQQALIKDPLNTFSYAFSAPMGSGSRSIIRAIYHLKDLGGTLDQAIQLYEDIQEYWEFPFEASRDSKMREQIQRLF